jgi:hypothetical protein
MLRFVPFCELGGFVVMLVVLLQISRQKGLI